MIPGVVSVLTKLRAFVDSFNRADNGSSLAGSTSPSNKWLNLRGVWGISGNKASSATAASSYPLATIKTGAKNARVKITNGTSGSCGYGVAFWVTDPNNWYGLVSDRTNYQSTYTYTYTYECSYSYQACGCGGSGAYSCGGQCCTNPQWGGDPAHACAQCGCNGCATAFCGTVESGCGCPGGFISSINYNGNGMIECGYCGSCGPAGTCAGTTTCTGTATGTQENYRYYANLIRMNAGTASVLDSRQLGSDTTSNSQNITYLQVETNTTAQNSVRTSASVDGAAPTTAVVAITSPAQTGIHGIVIAPRTSGTNQATQSTNVDDFDYTPLT